MRSGSAVRSWVCAALSPLGISKALKAPQQHATAKDACGGTGSAEAPDLTHQLPWLWAELLPRDRASDHCVSGKEPRAEAARAYAGTALRVAGGRLCGGTSMPPLRESSRRRLVPRPSDCSLAPPISGQLRVGGTLLIRNRSGTLAPPPPFNSSTAARSAD